MKQQNKLLKRITKLRDDNPNFAKSIEDAFPEIIDHSPYVVFNKAKVFKRANYPHNLYLLYCEEGMVKVRNLFDNKVWPSEIEATGEDGHYLYISEYDLNKLLKHAGTNLNSIEFVTPSHLLNLHHKLFVEVTP